MNKQDPRLLLIEMLRAHKPWDETEHTHLRNMIRFIEEEEECFLRQLQKGHLTGSAWITDQQNSSVVLVHHRKLDRWLQPGGHADGITDIYEVALKEAMEETGLQGLQSSRKIFDVDIHLIPANSKDPAHFHYDIRYHFIAPSESTLIVSPESHEVSWVPVNHVEKHSGSEPSILRMLEKSLSAMQKEAAQNQ